MPRRHVPKFDWFTGELNERFKPDPRGGDRHKPRAKAGFVAWDGEGVNVGGEHRYTLLANSEGAYLHNPAGIPTIDAFEFLLSEYKKYRTKHHVGFAFSYDVNMMLRDIPRARLKSLWENGKTYWRGYYIEYKPRREFVIRRGEDSFRVWDVWGFFQSSFVEGLKAYARSPEIIERISEMKDMRAEFVEEEFPAILEYCLEECRELAAMMEQFAAYLNEAELKISRYDGAGAVASGLLNKYGIKNYKREPAPDLQRAAAYAYFGGRIEMIRYGHTLKDIFQYDLRSAYPSVIQDLPCLAHGEWIQDDKSDIADERFTCYLVHWEYTKGDVCPFPWRDAFGGIFFPRQGYGWYWAPEVLAAVEAEAKGIVEGSFTIIQRWRFVERCNCHPFKWVPELYRQRAQWKRDGVGAEKVLKLGLNSLYGKCAQRIGHQDGKPPAYHQLEWAGYVTSAVRAKLYTASFPAILDGSLISYATDAIYSLSPLELDCTNDLGNWEPERHEGGTFVQSGVYWLGGGKVGHTRGFAKDDLKPEIIVKAWRKGETEIEWEITRFIGLGRALRGAINWQLWRTWETEPKALTLTPNGTKRTLVVRKPRPHRGLVGTIPTDPHTGSVTLSAPISLPWIRQESAFDADAARGELRAEDESDDCYD